MGGGSRRLRNKRPFDEPRFIGGALALFVFKHFPGGKPSTPTDHVGGHAFPENALVRYGAGGRRRQDRFFVRANFTRKKSWQSVKVTAIIYGQ